MNNNKNWKISSKDENEAVLFFVERIRELVFDYSPWYIKPIKPSVYAICNEAIQLIVRQQKDPHDSFNGEYDYLCDELKSALHTDEISTTLIGPKKDEYISAISNKTDLYGAKTSFELISLKLEKQRYLKKLSEILIAALKENKKKDRIFELTGLLVSTLKECGYEQSTIYHLLNRHFFDRSRTYEVTGIDSVSEFLKYFDLKRSKYNVTFSCAKVFSELKSSFDVFGLTEITFDKLPSTPQSKKFYNQFVKVKAGKRLLLSCQNVEAVDYQAARRIAEKRIRAVSDLFQFFHHKDRPFWSPVALVQHIDKNDIIWSDKPTPLMSKMDDPDKKLAAQSLENMLRNIRMKNESFNRLNRALELHAIANQSSELETQLLNLWIVFETLFVDGGQKSKISQVTQTFIEFFHSSFLLSSIGHLTESLLSWNSHKLNSAIAKLPPELNRTEHSATAALVSLKEYEPIVDELFNDMDDTPILRYRFMQFIRNLQSKNSIKSYIDSFSKIVSADIRRIYRTRNIIVHTGTRPPMLEPLTQRLHAYVDLVLEQIIIMNIFGGQIRSINQAIAEISNANLVHKKTLICNDALNSENVISILFGPRDYLEVEN